MKNLSEQAIDILNELHTERLAYSSEYLPIMEALQKLANLEIAEEEGRLAVLPCRPGTTLYAPTRNIVSEFVVTQIDISDGITYINWRLVNGIYGEYNNAYIHAEDIGKTVFLTKEEAEQFLSKIPQPCEKCGCYVPLEGGKIQCLNTMGCPYGVLDNDYGLD